MRIIGCSAGDLNYVDLTLGPKGRWGEVFTPTSEDDDAPAPFGAGLFAPNRSRRKANTGWFAPAPLPDRTAPKWGGERGISAIELKLALGASAVFGGVAYGAFNLVFG